MDEFIEPLPSNAAAGGSLPRSIPLEAFSRSAPTTPPLSADARNIIARQCLALKRIIDKEGIHAVCIESSIQRTLFSKATPNISVLIKCLRVLPDLDITITITNMLIRLTSSNSDLSASNTANAARKNISVALLKCIQNVFREYLKADGSVLFGAVPNAVSRVDELMANVFSLLTRVAKYDPKLSLLARLHGAVAPTIIMVKKWNERKEYALVITGLQALRAFATKNDNNVITIHKGRTLDLLASMLKNPISAPMLAQNSASLECVLDLMTLLTKMKHGAAELLAKFQVRELIALFRNTAIEALQKSVLKLLKTVVETEEGKKLFNEHNGVEFLTSALDEVVQASEAGTHPNGMPVTSSNSSSTTAIPTLLVAVLRSAVSQTDLPFLNRYQMLSFPLPSVEEDGGPDDPDDGVESDDEEVVIKLGVRTVSENVKLGIPSTEKKNEPSSIAESIAEESDMELTDKEDDLDMKVQLRSRCPELDIGVASEEDPANGKAQRDPYTGDDLEVTGQNPFSHQPALPITNIEVRHVQPITPRRAYGVLAHKCIDAPELTVKRHTGLVRKLVYEQMRRVVRPAEHVNKLVYDVMDESIGSEAVEGYVALDEQKFLKLRPHQLCRSLQFDSRFESGNLQLALMISDFEYDLILQTDINSSMGKHNQWFYFAVSRMKPGIPYKFNIVNLSKSGSQFNQGMQPVMYSRKDGHWRRIGDGIYYYKNHYWKPQDAGVTDPAGGTYATLTFSITFETEGDTCAIAYHYPYTFSDLQRHLFQFQLAPTFNDRCRRQPLCSTLGGNECVLLTITDFTPSSTSILPIAERMYILLSARVHPGESNSSHTMHGLLVYLLTSNDETATTLRHRYVFKIVPMLNPDGVVNGSHRCSLAGVDLNRQWRHPHRKRTPTVWWIKRLWSYIIDHGNKVLLTCDFHGHSRRKNVFIFGCENTPGSPHETLERTFPALLAQVSPTFLLSACRFDILPSKETTARVILRRELGIVNSFTLESSYCGADFGEKKGMQFQITDLQQTGVDFCRALRSLLDVPPPWTTRGENSNAPEGISALAGTDPVASIASSSSIVFQDSMGGLGGAPLPARPLRLTASARVGRTKTSRASSCSNDPQGNMHLP
ncbi:uncharacterized protein EV422DRAFT_496960 [Fimicolochytrium jonesii]|uniref:uncharacterized protein n=1 Tax=Fimicolochytrium jonesii TaxID=1396493 RepID=UPI0022FF2488|nr:uncharacterized protein EV422DRAFT_496960 [Fimicolochytrium jonesii]KAI8820492.1 hypothetical protein EV422DRAFT_496960 [Fimicolochytrium jonesii]